MHPFRGLLVVGGAVLVVASGAAAYAALQSCALNLNFLSDVNGCTTDAELAIQDELLTQEIRRLSLRAQIAQFESTLAAQQCEAVPPSLTAPLTRTELEAGDLEALYGCWSLGSDYQTRDVDTEAVVSYPIWSMCFDTQGRGKQVMEGDDGSICEGPVTARISNPSQLILGEGDNLSCSDGGYIHRRDIACNTAGVGVVCQTLQPETEGQADVSFARW